MGRIELKFDPDFLGFTTEVELDNTAAVKQMLSKGGKPVPPPERIRALIDTGASVCTTSERLIKKLKLPTKSAQKEEVNTPGGKKRIASILRGIFRDS